MSTTQPVFTFVSSKYYLQDARLQEIQSYSGFALRRCTQLRGYAVPFPFLVFYWRHSTYSCLFLMWLTVVFLDKLTVLLTTHKFTKLFFNSSIPLLIIIYILINKLYYYITFSAPFVNLWVVSAYMIFVMKPRNRVTASWQ